ncbi:hypothetical protein NEDG_01534 [Nematocida displodere]|uniref:Uncharacterized protein n=1 Tax=Nematocida displodere TaxID=1805483 RepID=A0A177EDH1_9MICR|nr:hypothetical protein NEDG_01534 [Nematocida displodere]
MLPAPALHSKEREQSDMADLEILGSISFDLEINKDEAIKNSFISLVEKLGTKDFLEEYGALYKKILAVQKRKETDEIFSLAGIDASELPGFNDVFGRAETAEENECFTLQEISTTCIDHKNE